MIKVIVQEERPSNDHPDRMYWITTNEIISEDGKIIAGSLRAIANRMDPPKTVTRGIDEGGHPRD